MISVVIPALDAGGELAATLSAFTGARAAELVGECLVVDGGSRDDTVLIAEQAGAVVHHSAPGRGRQLALGGRTATGDWLLFVHADTVLADDWPRAVADFTGNPANARRAAAFAFALDDERWRARLVEKVVAVRCRLFALPYGDQGLLISRALYDQLGGYKPVALMEDVDLVRRAGRRRLHLFSTRAVTSARRYERDGYVRRMARNLSCLFLWFAGRDPDLILRRYK